MIYKLERSPEAVGFDYRSMGLVEVLWYGLHYVISRLALNTRILFDAIDQGTNDEKSLNYLGLSNIGVANHNRIVYRHHRLVSADDVHIFCSGIVRLGRKKNGQTALWCPKCLTTVPFIVPSQMVQQIEASKSLIKQPFL